MFSIAQIEELGFDQFWKRKNEVIIGPRRSPREIGYYFSALLVTDVVRNTSLLLVTGAQAFIKQIDYPSVEQGIFELEGVVSRKNNCCLTSRTACNGAARGCDKRSFAGCLKHETSRLRRSSHGN